MSPTVREFYRGRCVLITGATGFVGKVLVEKLLRDCPDVKAIYLLLRQKKGVPGEERLKQLCDNKVFDVIREKDRSAFNKLKFVSGDILEEDLGLSNDDKQELQRNCHIIFHSAACVRFDQKLKDAVHMNTTGTLRLLELASTMESLEAFVHLSTAYCRCDLPELDERLYPAVHKPRYVMNIVDWMDDATLAHLEPKLIQSEPNTYSYTKAITEDLVTEYAAKFPIAIGRPSIVTASWKEPFPGWVDNLNGPTGLLIGSGKGVIRTMHCEPSYTADAVPVDVVASGCVLIAYATALDKAKEAQFFNMTLSGVQKITWKEVIETGEKWVNMYPFLMALWYPGGGIKSYWLTHQLAVLFFHILPAYFCDALLFLLGKQTFMVKVQKRISHGLGVLQYYTTKEWYFKNTRFLSLMQRLNEQEREIFNIDVSGLDRQEYLKDYVLGARHFVCKEDPASLPRARKLHQIRYVADLVVKALLVVVFAYLLYSRSGVFASLVSTTVRSWKNQTEGSKLCSKFYCDILSYNTYFK